MSALAEAPDPEPCTRDAAAAAGAREALREAIVGGPRGHRDAKPIGECALLLRHSGRTDGRWRFVGARTEAPAGERLFDQRAAALRQGGLALWHTGRLLRFTTAPRLRTRW